MLPPLCIHIARLQAGLWTVPIFAIMWLAPKKYIKNYVHSTVYYIPSLTTWTDDWYRCIALTIHYRLLYDGSQSSSSPSFYLILILAESVHPHTVASGFLQCALPRALVLQAPLVKMRTAPFMHPFSSELDNMVLSRQQSHVRLRQLMCGAINQDVKEGSWSIDVSGRFAKACAPGGVSYEADLVVYIGTSSIWLFWMPSTELRTWVSSDSLVYMPQEEKPSVLKPVTLLD